MKQGLRNVLVTGGAGFIGSHLIPKLLKAKYSVVVLDNLCSGKMANLEGFLSCPDFSFIEGDIRDQAVLKKAFRGVTDVVHLAALIDVASSVNDPLLVHDVNVTGTLNLLHESVKGKVGRFVFASSTAVYGDAKALPIKEVTPFNPISPYAASKAASEAYCCAFGGCYGLDTVRLRFFNVYGPRSENSPYSGVITKFLDRAKRGEELIIFGDGEQTRDFISVEDITDALVLALKTQAVGEAFNVCTGYPTSVNRLVETMREVVKQDLRAKCTPPRPGDILFSYGDPSKAKKLLKFTAKVGLKEGLESLIKARG